MKHLSLLCLTLLLCTLPSIAQDYNSQNRGSIQHEQINDSSFLKELEKFTTSSKSVNSAICDYFVFAIYVYPTGDNLTCVGYTVGILMNEYDGRLFNPDYYYKDSLNLMVVKFDTRLKNKHIPGIQLKKLRDMDILFSKLLSEEDGVITGTNKAFIYNDCIENKERIDFDQVELVPADKSIFKDFPWEQYTIEQVK